MLRLPGTVVGGVVGLGLSLHHWTLAPLQRIRTPTNARTLDNRSRRADPHSTRRLLTHSLTHSLLFRCSGAARAASATARPVMRRSVGPESGPIATKVGLGADRNGHMFVSKCESV